ncbi:DBH-like monooxygenase protein 1 [Lineus longissimus]|uniref:DBH-like monooxygenase protein 1 n=1 Tax=Lineus longissimus TaxID=88925 RepID=UPI00315CE9AB
MDTDKNYQLNWKATDSVITFEVIVKTTGYVGLGWSDKGGMDEADIITAWVDDEGTGHIQDRHGTGKVKPAIDTKQDVTLLLAQETNGYTSVKFTRPLDTCDEEDRPITTSTMRMIWAYGSSDPTNADALYQHDYGNRGTKSMRLIGIAPLTTFVMPENATSAEMKISNFTVPASDTHYECRLLEMPLLFEKHHVIRQEPIITPGNEAHVHHMILYLCPPSMNNQTYESLLAGGGGCGAFQSCRNPAFSFAIGGKGSTYPDTLGYPIGGDDEPLYARLEIHYDNPQLRSDVVDSSGFLLIYTPILRANDIGVLLVGRAVSQTHIIPPKQEKFVSYSFCNTKCTDESFERGGVDKIHMFGFLPHTHLAGRAVVTRHLRGDVELPYIGKDDNYDFNYQMTVVKDEKVEFKKGDELRVECTYNTMDRNLPVYGGKSTHEEMCMSFIYYYPRLPMVQCFSQPTFSTLQDIFSQHHNLDSNFNLESVSGDQFFDMMTRNMSWANAAAPWEKMEKTYNYDQVCSFGSGAESDSYKYFQNNPIVVIREPYQPTSTCKPRPGSTAARAITSGLTMAMSLALSLALAAVL